MLKCRVLTPLICTLAVHYFSQHWYITNSKRLSTVSSDAIVVTGDRSCMAAGPWLWNNLPVKLGQRNRTSVVNTSNDCCRRSCSFQTAARCYFTAYSAPAI